MQTADQDAIVEASISGDAERVRELLARDPELAHCRVERTGIMPIHFASHRGYAAIVEALLGAGAAVDAREACSEATALHWAAEAGHPEVARLLLAAGAALGAEDGWYALAPIGWTAVVWCAPAFHEDRAATRALLLSRGAALDPFSAVVLEEPAALTTAGSARRLGFAERGRLPLHLALMRNKRSMIEPLLALGADPHAPDAWGMTAAALALTRGTPALVAAREPERDVSLALARGDFAAAERALSGPPQAGLLHAFVELDRLETVTFLVAHGARLEETVRMVLGDTPSSVSPLQMAASRGALSAARALVALGAPLDAATPETGLTPLHFAAFSGRAAIVSFLLESGADATICDHEHGATPAGWAEYAGHADCLALLGDD